MSASRRITGNAARLPDGRVLVVGGTETTGIDSSTNVFHETAEIYDPATGTWDTTGSLATGGRARHRVTALPNGKVLVTGGWDGNEILSSAELYDPITGTFTETGPMTTARAGHQDILLDDGRVLITGGVGSSGNRLSSAEIYDPATGTFSSDNAGACSFLDYKW